MNLSELDAVLERALHEPLSDPDYQKLKSALHTLAGLATPERTTQKTESVLAEVTARTRSELEPEAKKPAPKPGHGRNGADAFSGAEKKPVRHAKLTSGDICPECEKGKVYTQKGPKALVRVIGQAPLTATVYELERLRCLCFMRHRQRYAACRIMPHQVVFLNVLGFHDKASRGIV